MEMPKRKDTMRIDLSAAEYNSQSTKKECRSNIDSSSLLSLYADNFPCGYCQHIFKSFPEMVHHVQNDHNKHDFEGESCHLKNDTSTSGKFKFKLK